MVNIVVFIAINQRKPKIYKRVGQFKSSQNEKNYVYGMYSYAACIM